MRERARASGLPGSCGQKMPRRTRQYKDPTKRVQGGGAASQPRDEGSALRFCREGRTCRRAFVGCPGPTKHPVTELNMKLLSTASILVVLSGLALAFQEKAPQKAQEKPAAPASDPAADAKVIAQQLPTYPLTNCPISHEALDSTGNPPVDLVVDGRLLRLCCKSCVKDIKKDPAQAAAAFKLVDEAVVKAQRDSYPLKTCPISGETLGAMGDPIEFVSGTRLVRL